MAQHMSTSVVRQVVAESRRPADFPFKGGALYKGGNLGQALYVDPARDFVGVAPYGEFEAPAFMRAAARLP